MHHQANDVGHHALPFSVSPTKLSIPQYEFDGQRENTPARIAKQAKARASPFDRMFQSILGTSLLPASYLPAASPSPSPTPSSQPSRTVSRRSSSSMSNKSSRSIKSGGVLDGFSLLEICDVEDPEDATEAVCNNMKLSRVEAEDLLFFTNLLYLDVGENRLSFADIANLVSLRELHLHCNTLDHIQCPQNAFLYLENLNLSFNALTGDCFHSLQYLPNLRQLDLSCNEIEHLPPDLSAMRRLQRLALEKNRFSDTHAAISALGTMPALIELNLNENRIRSIPPVDDHGFPVLEILSLAGNILSAFEDICDILVVETLKILVLWENPILARRRDLDILKTESAALGKALILTNVNASDSKENSSGLASSTKIRQPRHSTLHGVNVRKVKEEIHFLRPRDKKKLVNDFLKEAQAALAEKYPEDYPDMDQSDQESSSPSSSSFFLTGGGHDAFEHRRASVMSAQSFATSSLMTPGRLSVALPSTAGSMGVIRDALDTLSHPVAPSDFLWGVLEDNNSSEPANEDANAASELLKSAKKKEPPGMFILKSGHTMGRTGERRLKLEREILLGGSTSPSPGPSPTKAKDINNSSSSLATKKKNNNNNNNNSSSSSNNNNNSSGASKKKDGGPSLQEQQNAEEASGEENYEEIDLERFTSSSHIFDIQNRGSKSSSSPDVNSRSHSRATTAASISISVDHVSSQQQNSSQQLPRGVLSRGGNKESRGRVVFEDDPVASSPASILATSLALSQDDMYDHGRPESSSGFSSRPLSSASASSASSGASIRPYSPSGMELSGDVPIVRSIMSQDDSEYADSSYEQEEAALQERAKKTKEEELVEAYEKMLEEKKRQMKEKREALGMKSDGGMRETLSLLKTFSKRKDSFDPMMVMSEDQPTFLSGTKAHKNRLAALQSSS